MSPRICSSALVLLLGCGAPAPEAALPLEPAPRVGLWVLAEGTHRTLEDPARIDALVEDAVALGATDLFVQVYRAGRSWYPSRFADDSPYRAIRDAGHGDPLERLLPLAHAAGLRVHAWFNALSLASNREAPLLRALGRDAVLVDRAGRSLLDYPRHDVPPPDRAHTQLGTPGIWLDPAAAGVAEYIESTLADLIAASPDLDGLHLDFIRHPLALPITPGSRFATGLDFGYGPAARAGYEAENGRFSRGDRWDAYRRGRVDDLVRRLDERLPQGWELSAAVIGYADRAYLSAMQDWRHWLETGWLDFAVAMTYTRDDELLRYLGHSLRGGVGGGRVWLGLGSWLFVDAPERLTRQISLALAADPVGVAIFSYDAVVDSPVAMAAAHVPPIAPVAAGSEP